MSTPAPGRRRAPMAWLCVGVLGVVASGCGLGPPGPPGAGAGIVENRTIPTSISHLTFKDQRGRNIELASFRGKTTLVVPFLTLCTDICPFDTGNLLQVEHSLVRDGSSSQVQLVELSVDPTRDTPGRLAAYAHLTGASWELLTETATEATEVERFFGWDVKRVPEDSPPSVDWWTGKPLTYDVDHSDGFVIIDAHGTERFSTGAAPDFHGSLNPTLHRFLSDEGLAHLAHPQTPGWNPTTALDTLGWVLQRPLPLIGG